MKVVEEPTERFRVAGLRRGHELFDRGVVRTCHNDRAAIPLGRHRGAPAAAVPGRRRGPSRGAPPGPAGSPAPRTPPPRRSRTPGQPEGEVRGRGGRRSRRDDRAPELAEAGHDPRRRVGLAGPLAEAGGVHLEAVPVSTSARRSGSYTSGAPRTPTAARGPRGTSSRSPGGRCVSKSSLRIAAIDLGEVRGHDLVEGAAGDPAGDPVVDVRRVRA